MANTLVGVYENYNQAQSAMNALLDGGFSRSNVRISSEGGDAQSMRLSTGGENDPSAEMGIGGFFRSLFGLNDNDDDRRLSAYSQATDRGHCIVTVDTLDDNESQRAMDIMNRFNPVDIDDEGVTNTYSADAGISDTSMTTGTSTLANTAEARSGGTLEGGASIPIIEEELRVGKREVQRGGVRVYQRVIEKPVQESLNLREEHVTIERRPVDQPASAADLNAFQEQSFELRETAEEAVVSKTARVVEEVIVSKDVNERTETINDTVRRTDVDVEQLGTTGATGSAGMTGMSGTAGTTGLGSMSGTSGLMGGTSGGGMSGSGTMTNSNGPSVATTTGLSGTSAAETYRSDTGYTAGSSSSTGMSDMDDTLRAGSLSGGSLTEDDADYRNHWQSTYSSLGSTGGSYEDYAPHYRYGSEMAGHERYRGRRWDDVESDLRSDWETRNHGNDKGTWDSVKDSVRHGWTRMTK